jgi:SagB-type dehydrogenase family enzyme
MNCRLLLVLLASTLFCEKGGGMEEILLPPPTVKGQMSLEECIAQRRSVRRYESQKLELDQLGQLCWAAQGITEEGRGFKTAPSAGATYPLELYVLRGEGLFHYIPESHTLVTLKHEDLRASLAKAALGQGFIEEAPLTFVITAVYQRTTRRYGERGIMYVHMEVGHAAQNIHLQAIGLGLSSVPVGAFHDDEVSTVLSLPEDEIPVYIIPVGYKR